MHISLKLSDEERAAYFQELHHCIARFDDSSEKKLLSYAAHFWRQNHSEPNFLKPAFQASPQAD
jgi:hypothetical protein